MAQVSTSGTSSYLVDATGSTVAVGDSAGSISAAYTYAPYGTASASVSANTPFQYTGRENDGDTNLYYYRARYYSAIYNRFISEDPAGLFGGINPYGYVGGDPINRTDPSGKLGVVGAGIGAVVGGVGDLLYQMYVLDRSFQCVKWGQVAVAAGAGALVGSGLEFLLGAEAETASLFRAVGERELKSVMESGKFLPGGNSLEGRQFATTLEEALAYADTDASKVAIIEVSVDADVLEAIDFSESIDPFIFRNGVYTVQPGVQSDLFHAAIQAITHAF
jgi:RHS repeat-associated protein